MSDESENVLEAANLLRNFSHFRSLITLDT